MSYTQVIDPADKKPSDKGVLRDSDGAFIPADPANKDWQDYKAWLKAKTNPAAPAK